MRARPDREEEDRIRGGGAAARSDAMKNGAQRGVSCGTGHTGYAPASLGASSWDQGSDALCLELRRKPVDPAEVHDVRIGRIRILAVKERDVGACSPDVRKLASPLT